MFKVTNRTAIVLSIGGRFILKGNSEIDIVDEQVVTDSAVILSLTTYLYQTLITVRYDEHYLDYLQMSSMGTTSGTHVFQFFNPPLQSLVRIKEIPASTLIDKLVRYVEDPTLIYAYNIESLAVDDGLNVLRPDDLTPIQPGRWLRTGGGGSVLATTLKISVGLLGPLDGTNRTFTAPDKFYPAALSVYHNGRLVEQGIDYLTSESGGAGTGFDTITFISLTPAPQSRLLSEYIKFP